MLQGSVCCPTCLRCTPWLRRSCDATQTDSCRLDTTQFVGAGKNGQVHVYTTPLFPGAVLKSGKQGWLWKEADLMAQMRHPNIARVLAKVIPHGTPEQPDQPGFIAMELLGKSLKEYDVTRSAVMQPQQSDVSFTLYTHVYQSELGPIASVV